MTKEVKEKKATKKKKTEVAVVAAPFIPLDTALVQIQSLKNFMFGLGYTFDPQCKSGRFVSDAFGSKANRYISFDNAVRMHNAGEEDWAVIEMNERPVVLFSRFRMSTGFHPLVVRLARASRLVGKVKLGVSRGQLFTKSVMVKPLNDSIASLLEA
ncbi:hypothetical protein D3C80_965340 [compost metagenome]